MRYGNGEHTVLAGNLNAGSTVSIVIIDMGIDTAVTLNTNACTESALIAGTYLFDTNNITTQPTVYTNYLYVMTDLTGKQFHGKFVMKGYMDNIASDVWSVTTRGLTEPVALSVAALASIQTKIDALNTALTTTMSADTTIITDQLTVVDGGLKQILTNLGDSISVNSVKIDNSAKTMSMII